MPALGFPLGVAMEGVLNTLTQGLTVARGDVTTALPRDLALDVNGDLDLSSGDVRLTTGKQAVAQALDIALSLVKGEWFADLDAGVDVFGTILVSNPSAEAIKRELRSAALAVTGVSAVTDIEFTFDPGTRTLRGTVRATSSEGDIDQEVRIAA